MDHEGIMLYEMSDGERQIVWFYSYVKYKTTTTNEWSKYIATENTGVIPRGEEGECKMGKVGQLWWRRETKFWWWAHHSLYRSRNTMWYTWNIVINQCYFNKNTF